jgi:hypothetical protein
MTDTQMLKMSNGTMAIVGKPYLWKSTIYGDTAVHIMGFNPHENVAIISIDGGEASKQAQRFPALADGKYFVALNSGRLVKHAPQVKNTIREVPGMMKLIAPLQKHIDRMTVAQLKMYAKEIGMSTGTKLGRKAELKAAIMAFQNKEITF